MPKPNNARIAATGKIERKFIARAKAANQTRKENVQPPLTTCSDEIPLEKNRYMK